MKELAEQAATGSYSSAQRDIMNQEFSEMAAEIDRIAGSTSFNGNDLISATGTDVNIHVGTDEQIAVQAQNMTTASDGLNITTGTAGYEAVSDHGVDDSSTGAWVTFTGNVDDVSNSAGTQQNLTIQFTDSVNGTEELSIDVNLALSAVTATVDTEYTLDEVVEAINAVTLNLAVAGDGTVQAYAMASVVTVDGIDYLKLSSRTSDMDGVTIVFDTQDEHVASGGLAVAKAQTDFDVTEASGANEIDNGRLVIAAGTGLSIDTAANALTALDAITSAITAKDTARASFGYKMNRLESTISILNIQSENLMVAESRISDVDVATEMATMTRTQVLVQAGIAMLAQANTMPQMALSLLR
jgi:flagellin